MLANELINSNGISQVGLAFFTALLTVVSLILKLVYDERKEARESRKELKNASKKAELAAENAEAAVANTKNVSNGFASTVLGELRSIREDVQEVSTSLNKHVQWHLEREKHDDRSGS